MKKRNLFRVILCVALILAMMLCNVSCSKENIDDKNKGTQDTQQSQDNKSKESNEPQATPSKGIEYKFAELIDSNPVKTSSYTDNGKRSLYTINCNIDNEKKVLNCNEVISFVNTTGVDLENIALHLYPEYYSDDGVYSQITKKYVENDDYADMLISKVTIDGKDIEFTHENEILKFNLPETLSKDKAIDISIDFAVKMPCTTMRLTCTDNDYSVTYWYPIVCMYDNEKNAWDERPYHPNGESNYSYYNDYDVNITVPGDYVVAGTGIETEATNNDGTKTFNLKEQNVKDFVFFASPSYKVVTGEVDGIQVNSYYKSNKAVAERMLNDILSAMGFMNKAVGKYPFKEFDVVESNIVGFAMEYPTIIQLGEYSTDLGNTPIEDDLNWFDEAVVHEMVHQWFFNLVGNDCYDEPILDETMTVLWTSNYFIYKYGSINPMCPLQNVYLTNFSPELLPINRAVDEFKYENDYFATIYNLGWRVMEDVKLQVGEEKFLQVFRNYFDRYQFTNASVEKLLDEFELVCGKEIRDFLDTSINTKDYDIDRLFFFENDELRTVENGFDSRMDFSMIETDENTKQALVDQFNSMINDINSGNGDISSYFAGDRRSGYIMEYLASLASDGKIVASVYDAHTEKTGSFTVLYTDVQYGIERSFFSIMYNNENKITGFFY